MPAYFGVFVDSLAKEVDEFVLIAHTFNGIDEYALNCTNIRLVDLGRPRPAWFRHYFHKIILSKLSENLLGIDNFIIRAPSPLAPFFDRYVPPSTVIKYYVVGSYYSGAKEMKIGGLRDWFIRHWLLLNHKRLLGVLRDKSVVVNSKQLELELKDVCESIVHVPTTTLSDSDIEPVRETCEGNIVNILYTGRFDVQKGLVELFEAFSVLLKSEADKTLKLHLVGWEDRKDKPVENKLRQISLDRGFEDKVSWHGRKKLGEELWSTYRMADIYVLPSYHEGFPRTIWEAMAFALPVVTTNVGGIPEHLTHLETAYLCEPKNSHVLAVGIRSVIRDKRLRDRLIAQGNLLASSNTLAKRAKQFINIF